MSGTIVRIGVTGAAALLAVGLLAAEPAGAAPPKADTHQQAERSSTSCFDPSGRTQGKSYSDPDGMSNGGADKPGCDGGFDSDRDGNNGCGNDADREDDNNGNCGRKKHHPAKGKNKRSGDDTTTTTTTTAPTSPSDMPENRDEAAVGVSAADSGPDVGTVVLGAQLSAPDQTNTTTEMSAGSTSPAGDEAIAAPSIPVSEVLGESLSRPSALARTGAAVGLALLGGLLCGSGRLAVLARRFLRIG